MSIYSNAPFPMTIQGVESGLQETPSRELNKRTGTFYTPYPIAQTIAKKSINSWIRTKTGINFDSENAIDLLDISLRKQVLSSIKEIRILDPSVGEGVFLIAAADHLHNLRMQMKDKTLETEIRTSIISKNLYGVDIQKEPVRRCIKALEEWSGVKASEPINVKQGNSLIGSLIGFDGKKDPYAVQKKNKFHWYFEFPEIFQRNRNGFDIIIGNPPYGNIISDGEKQIIKKAYPYIVTGGRSGTWNIASLFIVRARMLLDIQGELGFLVPNSILRVGQFAKTREFLLNQMTLWEIVDEANPFDQVTLEMVSLFCRIAEGTSKKDVAIRTRRSDVGQTNHVPISVLKSSRVFPIYYDKLYASILNRAIRGVLSASRGRDIPIENLQDFKDSKFFAPFATRGSSVKRYRIDSDHIRYSNVWFQRDKALTNSFENEFLIATKNYPYPRCIMKPKKIMHGGGIVQIHILKDEFNPETIGLILNSRLVRYLSIRYLTNYAQLTTCLNTGIMNDLPIIYPKEPEAFALMFRHLQMLHQKQDAKTVDALSYLEQVADALVYALYLLDDETLSKAITKICNQTPTKSSLKLIKMLSCDEIDLMVEKIFKSKDVQRIENSPRMR